MYTNVLQFVGDVLRQRNVDPTTITKENFTPTAVVVSGKTIVLETFEGYEHYMKAIQSDDESLYDHHMAEAIRIETSRD